MPGPEELKVKKTESVTMDETFAERYEEAVQMTAETAEEERRERWLNHTVPAEVLVELENFADLTEDLQAVHPVFHRAESNLVRQRDRKKIEESKTKESRKQAAEEQKAADKAKHCELQAQLQTLRVQKENGEDQAIYSLLYLEKANAEKMQRQDVTGFERRSNVQRYAASDPKQLRMQEAARQDVDNLVTNIRMDIAILGEPSFPQELQICVDANYFTDKFSEQAIKAKTLERNDLRKKVEDGTATEEDKTRLKALEKAVKWSENLGLALKNRGTSFTPDLEIRQREVKARELALQQLREEGGGEYQKLMCSILEQELAEKRAVYESTLQNVLADGGMLHTELGQAKAAVELQLAGLRNVLKVRGTEITAEEYADVMNQAKAVFDNFGFEPEGIQA